MRDAFASAPRISDWTEEDGDQLQELEAIIQESLNSNWGAGKAIHRPQRIQLSREAGCKLPRNTVVACRPARWGKFFVVARNYPAERAIVHFELWLKTEPFGIEFLRAARVKFRGKHLACWCKPGELCHADLLLKLVDE